MRWLLNFLFISFVFYLACSDEPNSPSYNFSSLKVQVLNSYSHPIDSAIVVLRNTSFRTITDSLGFANFSNLQTGKFDIVAYIRSVGSGTKSIQIRPGENQLLVEFLYDIFFEPNVIISRPYPFATNDTVRFSCHIYDENTVSESIKVDFTFKNQLIQSGYPNHNGYILFEDTDFPIVIDTVFVTATNLDAVSTTESVVIDKTKPFRVKLELASDVDGIINLNWNASTDTNFQSYILQKKSGSDFIDYRTFQDQLTISYIDSSTLFASSMTYRIQTKNSGVYEKTSSNSISVNNPNGNVYAFDYRNTLIHPSKNYLYLFEVIDYDYNVRIKLYNYMTKEYLTETVTTPRVGYASIAETYRGVELVYPTTGGKFLIYDAENLTLKKSVVVGAAGWCSAITNNGIIYISHNYGMSSFNGETGEQIDSTNLRTYRLHSFTNKDALFGYVGYELFYINIDDQGHILSYIRGTSDRYLYEYVFSVSNSESYSIIGSSGYIFSTNSTLEFLGSLPFTGGGKTQCIFNNTDNLIYSATDDQYRLRCYDYPSLILSKVITTKGHPVKLFLRDNQLIVISLSAPWFDYSGIEKFTLD